MQAANQSTCYTEWNRLRQKALQQSKSDWGWTPYRNVSPRRWRYGSMETPKTWSRWKKPSSENLDRKSRNTGDIVLTHCSPCFKTMLWYCDHKCHQVKLFKRLWLHQNCHSIFNRTNLTRTELQYYRSVKCQSMAYKCYINWNANSSRTWRFCFCYKTKQTRKHAIPPLLPMQSRLCVWRRRVV